MMPQLHSPLSNKVHTASDTPSIAKASEMIKGLGILGSQEGKKKANVSTPVDWTGREVP